MNLNDLNVPIYNLGMVVRETGIKPDTLRAWERRYHLPNPARTPGGQRMYSQKDFELITWLMDQKKEGMTISKAVALWHQLEADGLDPLINKIGISTVHFPIEKGHEDQLAHLRNQWVDVCLGYDEISAENILSQAFAKFPLETVCFEILQVGMSLIGDLWYRGEARVQQEHFTSQLALRRIAALISAAPPPFRAESVLVACPENERHTFPALLITLLLRMRGWQVFFLGADVPRSHLGEAIESTSPSLIVMTTSRLATAAALKDTIYHLSDSQPQIAYGGKIFTDHPGLVRIFPGQFLGSDLTNAVSEIEKLLANPPDKVKIPLEPNQYQQLAALINEKRQEIELFVLEKIKRDQVHLESLSLSEIHGFFSEDISAALTLGDISLIRSNLHWANNLIANRGNSGHLLKDYLKNFIEALKLKLGNIASPLAEEISTTLKIMH